MNFLEKEGFLVSKKILSTNQATQYLELIKININKAASELEVTMEEYLSCTGRWATASPITMSISVLLEDKIKEYLENLLQTNIFCKKSNVICKTFELIDPIPFHQDISYSANDPYHFSVWLSLNDVDEDSAPLQIVQNSHKCKVESAVDFWSPYFVDKHNIDNKNIKSVTVQAGDAIIFDSKLWHGSNINHSRKDRFAYVTRWVVEGKNFSKIPEIKAATFGMFNCGKLTNQILENSLKLFDRDLQIIENKEELVTIWLDILTKNPNIEGINSSIAIRDLRKLNILNKACTLHDAGNISGLVYKNLWFSLLALLNSKLQLIEDKEYTI